MALQAKVELENQIFEEAYVRIQKIQSANIDYEQIIDDTLTYTSRLENIATVFVWVDKLARTNRAIPSHWFVFNFEYDLESNIYEQAYNQLNARKFNGLAINV